LSNGSRFSNVGATGTALFVTVLWSSSWVLIRWGLDGEGLEPLTFAALRYGIAAALLVVWVVGRERPSEGRLHIDRSTLFRIAGLGILLYTVTQGAQFVALDRQPAATTSLVLSLTPLLVAGLSAVSLAEAPTVRQLGGATLVAVGAAVFFVGDLGLTLVGMTAALVSLTANVGASLLGRSVNRRAQQSPVVVTAISMAVGAGLLVIVGVASEGIPSISVRAWLIIGWLAVVNTAVAFTLWNRSLQKLTAVASAGINNTMLIQIATLAWLFLDETPGFPEVAGVILVSSGVFLTQAATRHHTDAGSYCGLLTTPCDNADLTSWEAASKLPPGSEEPPWLISRSAPSPSILTTCSRSTLCSAPMNVGCEPPCGRS